MQFGFICLDALQVGPDSCFSCVSGARVHLDDLTVLREKLTGVSDVDGCLLSPPPSKDLDRVENLFCVELGELQQFAIRYPSNQIERLPSILSMLRLPYRGLLCFERRRYDVTQGYIGLCMERWIGEAVI